jgi:uncharacterized protein
LLRPEIPSAIKDVDHIIHAGDLGKMEILDELSGIAPTSIVRGNVDTGAWAASLPYNTVSRLSYTVSAPRRICYAVDIFISKDYFTLG